MSLCLQEIAVKGKWVRVPVLDYQGNKFFANGSYVRTARLLEEEWLDTELDAPRHCAAPLKSELRTGLGADIFTFTQKLPDTNPRYDYHTEWDSVAAARTSCFKAWWASLPRQTHQNVRRAQKRGVEVCVQPLDDHLIRGIVGLNNDSPIRQHTFYTHYGKTFEEVSKDHQAFLDRSDYICAYFRDELIGFMWMVYRGQIASIRQILTKASQRDKRPANALLAKAVEICSAKGLSHLTFGMFNYANKKHSSLREFKERNGFDEVLVPRYYIPLTAWGKFCIKAHLHLGLLGILPHSAIMAGLQVRSLLVNALEPSHPRMTDSGFSDFSPFPASPAWSSNASTSSCTTAESPHVTRHAAAHPLARSPRTGPFSD